MRWWCSVILLVPLVCLLGADGRDLDDNDRLIQDAELIQGQWELFSARSNGKSVGTDFNVVSVEGGFWRAGKFSFKYRLIPGRDPNQIDWDLNGQTWQGIYHIDGDKLWLCLSKPGQPRPVRFESREGDRQTLHVRRRFSLLHLE